MYEDNYQGYQGEYGMYRTTLAEYTAGTFKWMALGLLTTFLTAYLSYTSGIIYEVLYRFYPAMFIVAIAEIILVWVLSARIERLRVETATGLFFGYAVLNGFTFGLYLTVYATSTLFYVFLVTAGFFALMAFYGKTTDTDLTALRPYLFGGLICLVVFWIMSMFLDFTRFERIASIIGVAIFLAYTAFDTQKIRHYYEYYSSDAELLQKTSIISALALYLDFVNLFLYLLRIFGRGNRR